MSNLLKRKNEDDSEVLPDQLSKRVALDSEQLAALEAADELAQTAPQFGAPNLAAIDEQIPVEHGAVSSENPEEGLTLASNQIHKLQLDQPPNSYAPTPVSKPVLSHREKEDLDHVYLRMFCPMKEAGVVVGKKGERITHIREKAGVRIQVSENLKNVPERVVSVKGLAENVARAFGLITRTILDEPEDEPALMMSKHYVLRLLVPHPVIGYVIGKGGGKFREIEENSAAKLKAAELVLPYSTDRVLSVSGVADAIHIAVYYISQVLLEHKETLKKNKIIFYNPANFHHLGTANNPMMNMAVAGTHVPASMPYIAQGPSMQMPGMAPMKEHVQPQPYHQKAYDFNMMFQPAVRPQYNGPLNLPANSIPLQSLYTDEHGNTIIGDVIVNLPVQISTGPDRFTQDVFVANTNIGSVIGKGGNNIKQIRESSGCAYVKIEPDQHQSILLGGGRGLTNIRKLTLTGTYSAIQTAIFFINQRISTDKERNGVH
ncbi:hypothetical protein METBIDRAFT_40296 [Metschnikowia bicuspidata var. bicuspidata NRRL YB-4993]|uniref:K Homology domain-containing protein n=1 Tax=Metschnikowia bicuspidata var. bicuspidata NRRL YB-4993 TaxID=869754 RepID=A0A1A0HEU4_9ASCO|nr:hypothetical protein METBIDRAFT_40296 [Metschnikowia bicuspidata var. bicuspidata NRRL YB-4993]OBA22495.1 hypothetical protein METBIDRAFT_40296 [Metschnikowia bicuspidata var. bicuspidata NRRL YB-4993]